MISDAEYSDHRHGWFDIDSARIEEVKGGYIIRMPKALLLDLIIGGKENE